MSDALDGSPYIKAADRDMERMFHVKHPACERLFFVQPIAHAPLAFLFHLL